MPLESIKFLNVLSKLPLSEGHKSYQNNSDTFKKSQNILKTCFIYHQDIRADKVFILGMAVKEAFQKEDKIYHILEG